MIKLAKLNGAPEIFYTIQGEGKNLGKPSVFIRLSLCNLYCTWCDTDYTWNWKGTSFAHNYDALPGYVKYEKESLMILCAAEDIARQALSHGCKSIVITGGEPMVQKKDLVELLRIIKQSEPKAHIEFETNGTLTPGAELDALADQYNVSVKLANSKVTKEERIVTEAIRFFARSPKSNFKFVIDTEADLQEVIALQNEFEIAADKIMLMPQGVNAQSLNDKTKWIVELCKQHGFSFTDRLHIQIYGNKKGV
jgi:7-carboxy-7-deazaguanine synthase